MACFKLFFKKHFFPTDFCLVDPVLHTAQFLNTCRKLTCHAGFSNGKQLDIPKEGSFIPERYFSWRRGTKELGWYNVSRQITSSICPEALANHSPQNLLYDYMLKCCPGVTPQPEICCQFVISRLSFFTSRLTQPWYYRYLLMRIFQMEAHRMEHMECSKMEHQ